MNIKKKGFTLIELLAVIVILAVIALIATPVIFNTIEKSKKGSFEQTLINIGKGVKLYKAKVELDEDFEECRYFSFSDDVTEVTKKEGKTYYPLKELSLKGNLPIEGEIKVCDETIAINAGNGSYSGRYEDGETTVVKGELADNDLQPPVIDIFNVTSTRTSVVAVVSAHSQKQDGEIVYYYYKIDDENYIKTTEQSYVFEKLKAGQEYTITVMVENKSGITTEESKQIKTKLFGELTIDVEDSNDWTSSKNVTINGTTEEYKIEYKIRKYNEETKEIEESEFLEYTDSFTLDTMATNDYPILIIARYNDNGTYSNEKTYTVVNIDTTSPTNTKPVVNVSTTKPTSEASVVVRQDDSESGLDESTIEYGYSLDNVDYTWQASFELKKLKAGTKYYVKTRVTNNVGKTVESEATEYTPGEILTCSVSVPSGWATSKTVTITGTQTGVELQYQVGATEENGWNSIENEGTVTVEENTSVYCRLWDGTTAGGTGTGIVEGIDREKPELELKTEELTTNSVTIPYVATDTDSGPNKATCVYGTDTKYGSNGTVNDDNNKCTINNLKTNTIYYYKICVTDKVENGPVCIEGNTKPASMESPQIMFDNTPDNSVNGYYKEQTAQVTYITTGITNPRYFVKTDRTGTSNLTVINSCGTESAPTTSCTTIAETTTLEANTWYEVSGNVNVTYDTAANSVGTIYATTYDGTNLITPAPTGTLSKIDRTNPTLELGNTTTTTNSAVITYTAADTETGLQKATCKYSDKEGSYTTSGTVNDDNNSCTLSGLTAGKTYYYQICISDGVGNGPECKIGSASAQGMPKPNITFTNTPETAVNGYLESQVAHVTYTATGITSPRYFVKTTRAGVSSLTVTQSCGTGNIPTTSCETITGTTTLAANTWYEVSGNLDVTYNEYSATNGEIFAAIYDGTNFIDPIPSGTLMKITKETNYTVRHYQMNTDMTNYTLAETETLSGKVGYSVTPSVKTYTGFNSPATKTATLADGSTVVDYYYSRKQVVATFYRNTSTSDTTTATQTFTYGVSGQSFSAKGWSRTGYTLVGWAETSTGTGPYSALNGVADGWINSKSPSIKLYAVWVKNPTVTFAHTPSTLQNGYAKSSVATVTYSSTNVTSPVYYIKTTRAGTSSVAVTQSCGTGSSPGTCTTITSTTSLAANTWYKISGNTTVTYNTAASSTGTLYAYTYDGTTAKAQGSGTIPMIDTASPTITLGATTSTTDSITINYGIGDVSGIGSYTCSYGKEDPPYISSGNASYGSNASSVSTTKCTLSNLLPNKEYYYRICATDKVGNVSACKTGTTKTLLVKNVNSSGTTYFSSLQKAINNAISSKLATTVTLMDNTDGNVSINDGVENDNVVVDFNGKTLTGTILDFNLSSSLTLKNGTISGGIDRAIYNEGLLYIQNMTLKSETTEFNEAVWNTETGHIDMTDTNIISGTTYALKNSSTSTVNRINYPNTITGKIKGNVLMVVKTTTGVQFRIFGKTVTACTASVSSNGKSATYNASSTTNSYGTYYYCDINKANHGNATGTYSISVINNGSLVIGTTFEMR